MPRDPNVAGLMMGALAVSLATEMSPGPYWEPRDHTDRLDSLYGERDRQAAEAKRARKAAKRTAGVSHAR